MKFEGFENMWVSSLSDIELPNRKDSAHVLQGQCRGATGCCGAVRSPRAARCLPHKELPPHKPPGRTPIDRDLQHAHDANPDANGCGTTSVASALSRDTLKHGREMPARVDSASEC